MFYFLHTLCSSSSSSAWVTSLTALLPPRSFCLSTAKINSAAACCLTQSGRMKRGGSGERRRERAAADTRREEMEVDVWKSDAGQERKPWCCRMRARGSHPPSEPCRRSRSSVWVRVSVLRDPTVGVSVESHGVLFILVTPSQQCLESKLGFFLFFCLAPWVVGIEEFQMMVTVQIKLPLCFTQVNGTDLSNYFSNLF